MKADSLIFQQARNNPILWVAFLSVLVAFAWAYSYFGGILIIGKNTDRTGTTQAAFIDAVYRSASLGLQEERPSILGEFSSALPQYTDGIVDPLFPWMLRGMADEAPDKVFEAGKWLNFTLSGVLLLVLALGAARAFSFSGAAAVVLMGGFGVILERSAYFSPDALYYLLVVLTWLCALSLIRQNHLWLYGVFGLLLGFSFLAKPLVWPVFAGFVVVSIVRSLWTAFRTRRNRVEGDLWSPSNQLVGFAMTIAAFLLVTGPRLSYSAKTFGDPFHSYQKYFIWLDGPEEAARFQAGHPGKAELDAIPAGETPGLARFLRDEGGLALLERGWRGALSQVKTSVLGRGGWILTYGAFVFLVVAAIHRWAVWHQDDEVWRVRGTSARWMLLFLGAVVFLSLCHAGIGDPVIAHSTMTTSLFLPILVTFVWISERYRRQMQRSRFARMVNWVYLVLMTLPILWITYRIVVGVLAPAV